MSGTRPQRISITAQRVSGWTMRMSAPEIIFSPPPIATPWAAATTGTGSVRQPQAICCGTLANPWVRGIRSMGSASLLKFERSSPAQKPRPSPETTTARRSGMALSSSIASQMASNIAGSSAFILSARVSVIWAICDETVMATRSDILHSGLWQLSRGTWDTDRSDEH